MSSFNPFNYVFKSTKVRADYPVVDSSAAVAEIVDKITQLSEATGIPKERLIVVGAGAECLHKLTDKYTYSPGDPGDKSLRLTIRVSESDMETIIRKYPHDTARWSKIHEEQIVGNRYKLLLISELGITVTFRPDYPGKEARVVKLVRVYGLYTLPLDTVIKDIVAEMEEGPWYTPRGHIYLHKQYPYLATRKSKKNLGHVNSF